MNFDQAGPARVSSLRQPMLKRLLPFLVPACLFLLVFGFKLDVIHRYGSDLPRWDQLDAEGLAVFVPLAENRLGPADLLRPHNEHRIVWTKLLGLTGLQLNGQWDARLQCTINAALHSSIAVFVFLFARRGLAGKWHAPVFVLVALLFGLPLAWENPLAGFHSQQYFLLGFSFGALCLLTAARPWSLRWWAGTACLVAALFSMGSGLFAAAIVLGGLALQSWIEGDYRGVFLRSGPTVVVCAIVLGLGALGRVSVNYHDPLRAGSVLDFLRYTLHCLQWPAQEWSWLALIVWWPVAVLVWHFVQRRDPDTGPFPLVLISLAAWVILQILATAYTRGAGGGMPSSRYADTLAFGLVVNGLALAWLWPRFAGGWLRASAGVAWVLAVALPAGAQLTTIFRQVYPDSRIHLRASEENVRRYLATDDASHLDRPDLPYPGIRSLRERIDLPAIRAILPASVRLPMALETAGDPGPFASHSSVRRARSAAPATLDSPAVLAALPRLDQRTLWVSDPDRGIGEWRSKPLPLTENVVLKFLVAGHPGARLSIVGEDARARAIDVAGAGLTTAHWRWVHVSVPAGTRVVQANITGADQWLAFSEPVGMAPGSYWCWRLVRTGGLLWPVAALAAVLLGLGAWYCARQEKALGWHGRSGGTPA